MTAPKPNTTNSELRGYWHKARCPYADYDYSVICDCFLGLEALIASKVREARVEMANNLIDQERGLYKVYGDDDMICVGIKIMADEVREYYDGGIYAKN